MVSKRLRITPAIITLTTVWLLFPYEAAIVEFLTNGGIVIIVVCTGTYFAARLFGITDRK